LPFFAVDFVSVGPAQARSKSVSYIGLSRPGIASILTKPNNGFGNITFSYVRGSQDLGAGRCGVRGEIPLPPCLALKYNFWGYRDCLVLYQQPQTPSDTIGTDFLMQMCLYHIPSKMELFQRSIFMAKERECFQPSDADEPSLTARLLPKESWSLTH